MFLGKQYLPSLPLVSIKDETPIRHWGLDFIGDIHPPFSAQYKWILTTRDYFSKWVEAIPTINATHAVLIKFLEENILARFGCPRKIITDNPQAFKYVAKINFCQKYNIILGHSTAYYTQGNGLENSSNKILMRIIKKIMTNNKKAWHSHLKYALWTNRISTKISTSTSPYQLIYGMDAILPSNLSLPAMKLF
jgi:hypothetical protein